MNSSWLSWGLLLLWAGAIIAGLGLYSREHIRDFDPALSLTQAAADPDFDKLLTARLAESGIYGATVVHFEGNPQCYCNTLSESHQDALVHQLEPAGYSRLTLNLTEHPQLAGWVPSYPAVAIIDDAMQLRYLGPYATGYGCFTGDTLTDSIARIARQSVSVGAVVNSEASGCFCPT